MILSDFFPNYVKGDDFGMQACFVAFAGIKEKVREGRLFNIFLAGWKEVKETGWYGGDHGLLS